MSPIELFHEARLNEAIAAQRAVVAGRPDDVPERLLLCELLTFTGDREAVRRELMGLGNLHYTVRRFVREWLQLMDADDARHRGDKPAFFLDPPRHILKRLRGLECIRAGRADEALDLLDDADDRAGWIEGHVDGRPFDGWRDADDLLGPVLEVFQGDRFVWVAMEQVRKLRLEDGEELRDILYSPATIWLADESKYEVFIPGLYVGTSEHPEEGICTGAGIDWVEVAGVMRGLGSRTFLFGEEELTLAEFRQVEVRG